MAKYSQTIVEPRSASDANTVNSDAGAFGNSFNFKKDRDGSIVQNNDELGYFGYFGYNGTSYDRAAYVIGHVDGVPGASGDMPGRLSFATAPDGSVTATVRMTIKSDGNVGIGTTAPATRLDVRTNVGEIARFSNTGNNQISSINFYKNTSSLLGKIQLNGSSDNSLSIVATNTLKLTGSTVENQVYTKLGSTAPAIKMKKLTGTSPAAEGGAAAIPHGMADISKILSTVVIVEDDTGRQFAPGYTLAAENEYQVYVDATNVLAVLASTNSGNLLSNPIRVLITYES